MRKTNMVSVPKSLWGGPLPTGKEKKDKIVRKHYYIKDGLIFASVITILDAIAFIISNVIDSIYFTNIAWLNALITIVVTYIIAFGIAYGLGYLMGERAIKKYNQK